MRHDARILLSCFRTRVKGAPTPPKARFEEVDQMAGFTLAADFRGIYH